MKSLRLPGERDEQTTSRTGHHVLCLGAHSDDIEIGAAGSLLTLLAGRPGSHVTWVVACAHGERADEARESAENLLNGFATVEVRLLGLRDGYLDGSGAVVKEAIDTVRKSLASEPDVVFTHYRHDRHQDHRSISDITWNLWRNHLILEYEVPKWDGDMGSPNVFVPLAAHVVERKLAHLATHFASQRTKDWYDDETLRGLMRLRGVECRSASRYAEAFYGRKVSLSF